MKKYSKIILAPFFVLVLIGGIKLNAVLRNSIQFDFSNLSFEKLESKLKELKNRCEKWKNDTEAPLDIYSNKIEQTGVFFYSFPKNINVAKALKIVAKAIKEKDGNARHLLADLYEQVEKMVYDQADHI